MANYPPRWNKPAAVEDIDNENMSIFYDIFSINIPISTFILVVWLSSLISMLAGCLDILSMAPQTDKTGFLSAPAFIPLFPCRLTMQDDRLYTSIYGKLHGIFYNIIAIKDSLLHVGFVETTLCTTSMVRATLCTIYLHCAPPTCSVHWHGAQGRPMSVRSRSQPQHFSQWTCSGGAQGHRCTQTFTTYIEIKVHYVVLYQYTIWWCTM